MGKGIHRVNRKDQLCYECRIRKIDNGTVFYIFCGNFKIEEPPSTPFEDEIVVRTVVTGPQDPERKQTTTLRESFADVDMNINVGLSQEIVELRQQRIDVEDDNDPAPQNAQTSAPETNTIGQRVTPTIYPGRADVNCRNTKGIWRLHSWPKKSEITELSLFRITFHEQWVRDVLIPATNEEIVGDDITLQECYVYLG